jgi:hypothetical protein
MSPATVALTAAQTAKAAPAQTGGSRASSLDHGLARNAASSASSSTTVTVRWPAP